MLSDALGRGHPRARGDRVRVRDPDPAQGRVLGAGLDRDRRLLDPAAARRRRRDHAVQLPGDGAHVDVGAGDRLREHVRAQALREGPVRVDLHGRAAQGGGPAGRRLQRHPRRQGRGRRGWSSTRTSPRSASSARRRSRSTSTRQGTARGKRVQALAGAKNHMLVLPDADIDMAADAAVSAAYGSAGERCMAVSVVVTVGDAAEPLIEAIQERLPKVKVGSGPRAGQRDGPADHPRAPRQGRLVPRLRGRAGREGASPTAASSRSRATASSSASR